VDNIMSSKLFTTRQGTVLLGVIAAVIAAIALLVYLNHYRNSVKSGAPISVLVAQKLIQKGTPGDVIRTDPTYYKVASIPKGQVENNAFVSPATLAGQVATTDVSPGQQLTASDFGPAGTSISTQLPRTQRAVVVSLESPNQVGGQITAGSHVDVWTAFNGQGSNGVTRPVVRELFQNMTVLGVASSGGNVTLEATPRQSGTLIFASENATLWLVLRPTVATTDRRPPVISVGTLLGAQALRIGR
jgi:Flp pilus assembly protein CpaB